MKIRDEKKGLKKLSSPSCFYSPQPFRHQMCGLSMPTASPAALWTPTGCPAIQRSSDTNCLGSALAPQFTGSAPQDCPTSDARPKYCPGYPSSVQLGCCKIWGSSSSPLSGSVICQNSEKCFTCYYQFITEDPSQEQPRGGGA